MINVKYSSNEVQWKLDSEQGGVDISGISGTTSGFRINENELQKRLKDKTISFADGRKQASVKLTLKANALVDQLDIIITANRASLVEANTAADVRVAEGEENAIIVDFGLMLTVNLVSVSNEFIIDDVYPWLGTKFDWQSVVSASGRDKLNYATFPDLKTERLLIKLNEEQSASDALSSLQLSLPDLPAGLSVRINDDEPSWVHDPMVQLSTSTDLSYETWNSEGKRLVSMKNAIAKYTQNSSDESELEFDLILNSAIPGKLELAIDTLAYRHIHRVSFENEKQLLLAFDMEGQQELLLAPPSSANEPMTGVQFNLGAQLNTVRAIPAIGPQNNGLIDLSLGKGKSAIVRLDNNDGLVELSALRFPFVTTISGAEASIVLWSEQNGMPLQSIENAVSQPVNWTGEEERWVRFEFTEPVAIEPNQILWAAIHISRGEVTWRMASSNQSAENQVRIGPAGGPYRALPAIFGDSTSLGNIAGRLHLLGLADQTAPMPPISISLEESNSASNGNQSSITPLLATDEDIRIAIELDSFSQKSVGESLALSITSLSEGSVTISEVDLITGDKLS
jgi:hypothetical protein